jgi:hypothetical protein
LSPEVAAMLNVVNPEKIHADRRKRNEATRTFDTPFHFVSEMSVSYMSATLDLEIASHFFGYISTYGQLDDFV